MAVCLVLDVPMTAGLLVLIQVLVVLSTRRAGWGTARGLARFPAAPRQRRTREGEKRSARR